MGRMGVEDDGQVCVISYAGQFNFYCLLYLHLHNYGCNAPADRQL